MNYFSWPVVVILIWLLASMFAGVVGNVSEQINLTLLLQSPGTEAIFGTDELGRQLWARLLQGAQTSAMVAMMVVSISMLLGTSIGMLSAYVGGRFDRICRWVIDVFLAFPHLLLAIALAAVLGAGIGNLVLALSLVGWVGFARLARGQTLSLRNRQHVQAAMTLGLPHYLILWRHVLPLLLTPLAIEATFGIAGVVIAEAGLSFLGLGVQSPQASWGSMIREGARFILVAPHLVLVPGLSLMLVILAVNRLGDALRDHLDVKNSGSR